MAFGQRTQASSRSPAATDQPLDWINLPMTVPEVASVLRTSRKAIYAMIERRNCRASFASDRRVLMHREDLLDWLRQKSAPSPER